MMRALQSVDVPPGVVPGSAADSEPDSERHMTPSPSSPSKESTKKSLSAKPLSLWIKGMHNVCFDDVVTARKARKQRSQERAMRLLLMPGCLVLTVWRAFMVAIVIFAVAMAPLEMAFSWSPIFKSFSWILQLVDVFFILDMLLNFVVATTSHGKTETSHFKLAQNYLKGWFVADLLINFPWDVVLSDTSGKSRKVAKLLKLPKVLRVTRLVRVAREEAHYFGTMFTLCGIILMAHYSSCVWAMLLIECDGQSCPDVFTAYAQGLSVGMASILGSDSWLRFILTAGGNGSSVSMEDAAPDHAFRWQEGGPGMELIAAFTCLFGACLVGMLYNNIALAMDRRSSPTRLFHERLANLKSCATQHKIPKELYERVRRHYYYVWSCGSDVSKSILKDTSLSVDLRRQLAYGLYGNLLMQVPFLESADPAFVMQLCEFVEMEIFAANDRIISAGEVGTEMYFIAVGKVQIKTPDNVVIKELDEGSFFGELGLLFPDCQHGVDVCSITAGWLLVIPRGTLESVCSEELLATFRSIALERVARQLAISGNSDPNSSLLRLSEEDSVSKADCKDLECPQSPPPAPGVPRRSRSGLSSGLSGNNNTNNNNSNNNNTNNNNNHNGQLSGGQVRSPRISWAEVGNEHGSSNSLHCHTSQFTESQPGLRRISSMSSTSHDIDVDAVLAEVASGKVRNMSKASSSGTPAVLKGAWVSQRRLCAPTTTDMVRRASVSSVSGRQPQFMRRPSIAQLQNLIPPENMDHQARRLSRVSLRT
ncbi:unnamed protein product [Polarella glacialis]|uniref:Cyclic nucleotide-binding domain-containing protein n=1 Tax=Polarella glacialis TaxID=89957 RepID=A0A813H6X5_POLGL|nr:unnamed protein product [Polarella glacialis]CAE8740851.1 unnamed protein product [Polarella glacialis]